MENIVDEPAPKYNYISEQDYLETERAALEKHEYYQGEVFAMGGASLRHNVIFKNTYGELCAKLKEKNCQPYGSDLRIHIPQNTLYTYPDISIICGEVELTDDKMDTAKNPVVIIALLSTSTRNYDRFEKFSLYREIPSFNEYILIDTRKVHIEKHIRNADKSWQLTDYYSITDAITITSVNITVSLTDIYAGISFLKDLELNLFMDNTLNEPALKYNFISLEEYLEIEATSEGKNEYYNGQLVVMQGASLNHNGIVANLITATASKINGNTCRVYPSDVRLSVSAKQNIYVYPDAMIICGKPELTDDKFDTVTNPAVLFEVISESSENNDRRKFFHYMQMNSVSEIVLINSYNEIKVELGIKQPNGSWQLTSYTLLSDAIKLSPLTEPVLLSDIYKNITF